MDELELLQARAIGWAMDDCDPRTAEQCRELAAGGDLLELRDHFAGQLEFGTAGLRAKVGPGPWRMNRATVRRTTRAVAEYLLEQVQPSKPRVVVAFDARASSADLALETCGTLAAAGVDVLGFPEPVPTPLAAFALRREAAHAAIVITASHNPKEYNGYKLYGPDGAQIVSPMDVRVQERLATVGAAKCIERHPFTWGEDARELLQRTTTAYFAALRQLHDRQPRRIRIAYTPLHGLGAPYVERALNEAGFSELTVVPEQREPHPEFPTVPFPNPEEAGVMERVLRLAQHCNADLALATDPDVDRLAVGIKSDGSRFEPLSGNQVGILLADHLLRKHADSTDGAPALVVQSVVSTPMVGEICAAHGARWERTLTGFKWIERPAIALGEQWMCLLGFEEALGYATLPDVRDKDGISAALVLAQLANECALSGSNLASRLFELYQRHGLWTSLQQSVQLPGAAGVLRIERAMKQLRDRAPVSLNDVTVTEVTDYAKGAEHRAPWLPKANLVELTLGGLGRILVRPSGTEPKLKIYVDVRQTAPDAAPGLAEAEGQGRRIAAALGEALVRYLALDGAELPSDLQ